MQVSGWIKYLLADVLLLGSLICRLAGALQAACIFSSRPVPAATSLAPLLLLKQAEVASCASQVRTPSKAGAS